MYAGCACSHAICLIAGALFAKRFTLEKLYASTVATTRTNAASAQTIRLNLPKSKIPIYIPLKSDEWPTADDLIRLAMVESPHLRHTTLAYSLAGELVTDGSAGGKSMANDRGRIFDKICDQRGRTSSRFWCLGISTGSKKLRSALTIFSFVFP